MRALEAFLNEKNIKFARDMSVASLSTFKIGGVASIAIFPKDARELCDTALALRDMQIKFEVIGNASNILFGF